MYERIVRMDKTQKLSNTVESFLDEEKIVFLENAESFHKAYLNERAKVMANGSRNDAKNVARKYGSLVSDYIPRFAVMDSSYKVVTMLYGVMRRIMLITGDINGWTMKKRSSGDNCLYGKVWGTDGVAVVDSRHPGGFDTGCSNLTFHITKQ